VGEELDDELEELDDELEELDDKLNGGIPNASGCIGGKKR